MKSQILISLILTSLAFSSEAANADDTAPGRPRLIVALSGGGCKAVGQIGVLRSLEKNKIRIDGIVGVSMGATIGALYCAGVPLDTIEEMFVSGKLQKNMFKGITSRILTTAFEPLSRAVGVKGRGGYASGKSFERYLATKLPATFDQLKIPFSCVATNLVQGSTEVIAQGDLPLSVVASNCVPVVCGPIEMNGSLYIDGNIRNILPSQMAKSMHPDVLVAAVSDAPIKPVAKEQFSNKLKVMARVMDMILDKSDRSNEGADVVVYPDVEGITYLTTRAEVLKKGVDAGELATDVVIGQIKNLAKMPPP